MPLDLERRFPVMCLTFDGISLSHAEQVERLCSAGSRWIQLRMKGADKVAWLSEARAVAAICRRFGAVFIVNDSVDVALESGADGVHLGNLDEEWAVARRRLGARAVVGGTVNNVSEAQKAADSGCLDYAGAGPLRFTSTKRNLAPILGLEGIGSLIQELGSLPAWIIGGVEAPDLPMIREAGASGVAVSSSLFREGRLEENLRCFLDAWNIKLKTPHPVLSS
jgi:thiamine-phosphate diphosphorylase